MIQLVFSSNGKLMPEWQAPRERFVFRLAPVQVRRSAALHQQADEAGQPAPEDAAMGQVALQYEGDTARRVEVIVELPDDAWDNLANWVDDLLDEGSLLSEDEDLFDQDDA